MKKQNMFKVVLFTILAFVVLTWLIPTGTASGTDVITEGLSRIGIFDILQIPFSNYVYFVTIPFFILGVSAFYGVLSKSGKYTLAVNKLAKSLKGKERVTLIVVTVLFALLTALGGFNLTAFALIPLVVTILVALGYDRMVGFVATFGATLIGTIGSIYNENVTGIINQVVTNSQLTLESYHVNLIVKIALLVLSLVVYIFFVDKYGVSVKKSATRSVLDEGKKDVFELAEPAKTGSTGMYVFLGIFALIIVLAVLPWESVWGIKLFTTITDKILSVKIAGHTVFKYFLGSIPAFGSWGYDSVLFLMIFGSIVAAVVGNLSFAEFKEGAVDGLKKAIVPSCVVLFAYSVFILSVYYPIYTTVQGWVVNLVGKFNALSVLTSSVLTILGTILSVDTIYSAQQVLPMLVSAYADNAATIAVVFQAIHGVTLFLAPTSVMLILGLEYLNIPYRTWVKFAFKTVLEILIIVLIVLLAAVIIF